MQEKFRKAREKWEKAFILDALKRHGGNQSKTAKAIGLHRNHLFIKIKKYGLSIKVD